MNLPPGVPPEAAAILQEMGYFEPDRLQVGDRVVPLTLSRTPGELSGESTSEAVTIGAPDAARPTVLIFGSYT